MQEIKITAYIKDLLINSLSILKDEDYQRRIWFREEGPEVSSYIDTVTHLLDRCKHILEYTNSSEKIGKENYDLLRKLSLLVREHVDLVEERKDPDLLTEDELLNDPNWHDIQMLAEEVEEKLLEFLKRENT